VSNYNYLLFPTAIRFNWGW